MRTQEEIKTMIHKIRHSGIDIAGVQQRTLMHKLEWKEAVNWMAPERRTQENRQKFESMNSVDEACLRREIIERIDQLFMFLADGDLIKIQLHFQMILVYLWLMKKDELFTWLHNAMCDGNYSPRWIGRHLADELQINWKTLELRYV